MRAGSKEHMWAMLVQVLMNLLDHGLVLRHEDLRGRRVAPPASWEERCQVVVALRRLRPGRGRTSTAWPGRERAATSTAWPGRGARAAASGWRRRGSWL